MRGCLPVICTCAWCISCYRIQVYELALVLNGIASIPDMTTLEQQMVQSLHRPVSLSSQMSQTPKKVNNAAKSHFIYLLLDSRKADRMEHANKQKQELSCFRAFVESVFYVGKGKNARSLQHLKDAKSSMQTKNVVRSPHYSVSVNCTLVYI